MRFWAVGAGPEAGDPSYPDCSGQPNLSLLEGSFSAVFYFYDCLFVSLRTIHVRPAGTVSSSYQFPAAPYPLTGKPATFLMYEKHHHACPLSRGAAGAGRGCQAFRYCARVSHSCTPWGIYSPGETRAARSRRWLRAPGGFGCAVGAAA